MDRPGPRPYWQMALMSTLILLPIVDPAGLGVARPIRGDLAWFGRAAALADPGDRVALLGLWLFAAHQSDDSPQDGALVFLPAAVLVPAILGAPGSLDETSALSMLGEAYFVAGVAIFVGLLAPASWRPLAGAVALGDAVRRALDARPRTGHRPRWRRGGSGQRGLAPGADRPADRAHPAWRALQPPILQTVDEEAGGPRPARRRRGERAGERWG